MLVKLFKTPRIFRWIYPRRTWGFSSIEPTVYLTFDDGPNPEITPWVLDFLDEQSIKATFFCVGENLLKNPVLAERIRREGHTIANHTMHHEKSSKVAFESYRKSVNEVRELTKNSLFRPPYGRISMLRSRKLSKDYKIVMWSWLSYDFDFSVPVETILKKAKQQIGPGDIIVLHDNAKVSERLQELLPKLVGILLQKGYSFAKINA